MRHISVKGQVAVPAAFTIPRGCAHQEYDLAGAHQSLFMLGRGAPVLTQLKLKVTK